MLRYFGPIKIDQVFPNISVEKGLSVTTTNNYAKTCRIPHDVYFLIALYPTREPTASLTLFYFFILFYVLCFFTVLNQYQINTL